MSSFFGDVKRPREEEYLWLAWTVSEFRCRILWRVHSQTNCVTARRHTVSHFVGSSKRDWRSQHGRIIGAGLGAAGGLCFKFHQWPLVALQQKITLRPNMHFSHRPQWLKKGLLNYWQDTYSCKQVRVLFLYILGHEGLKFVWLCWAQKVDFKSVTSPSGRSRSSMPDHAQWSRQVRMI